MASTPERSAATVWLCQYIESEVDVLVGKVTAPDGGGWQADPSQDEAEFIPYVVVTPGTGVPVDPSYADPSQDWNLSYQVTIYGTDDDQVERLADDVRNEVLRAKKIPLVMTKGNWRMNTVKCNSIGGVGYTTVISPTAFSQTDSYTMTLSRSIA